MRFRVGQARATLVRAGLLGCSGLIAALALAAVLVPAPPRPLPGPAALDGVVAPAWIDINHPLQLFTLAGSSYAALPLDYRARRRPDGSTRQDTLTHGTFGGPAPFLTVSLDRSRNTPETTPDLVVTAARIAGAAGIAVLHAGRPDALPSRLGLFSVTAVTLRAAADQKPCLGFRLEGRPPLAVAGLACGAQGRAPALADLACTLDRLDLTAAAEDLPLRSFFSQDQRPAPGCADLTANRS